MSWKWLFFYRWIVTNAIGFVGIFAILFTRIEAAGIKFQLYEAITSNEILMWFSILIFATYILFFLLGTFRAYIISRTLNEIDAGEIPDELNNKTSEHNALLLFGKLILIRFIPSALISLGMLGTVFGFILMVYGISPDLTVEELIPVIYQLTSGLGIAFITTGIGLTLSLWSGYLSSLLEKETGDILRKIHK